MTITADIDGDTYHLRRMPAYTEVERREHVLLRVGREPSGLVCLRRHFDITPPEFM